LNLNGFSDLIVPSTAHSDMRGSCEQQQLGSPPTISVHSGRTLTLQCARRADTSRLQRFIEVRRQLQQREAMRHRRQVDTETFGQHKRGTSGRHLCLSSSRPTSAASCGAARGTRSGCRRGPTNPSRRGRAEPRSRPRPHSIARPAACARPEQEKTPKSLIYLGVLGLYETRLGRLQIIIWAGVTHILSGKPHVPVTLRVCALQVTRKATRSNAREARETRNGYLTGKLWSRTTTSGDPSPSTGSPGFRMHS